MQDSLELSRGPTGVEIFESPEVIVTEETRPLKIQVALLTEEVRTLKEQVRALARWVQVSGWRRSDGYEKMVEPAVRSAPSAGSSVCPERHTG